jgi:hypothetical protein
VHSWCRQRGETAVVTDAADALTADDDPQLPYATARAFDGSPAEPVERLSRGGFVPSLVKVGRNDFGAVYRDQLRAMDAGRSMASWQRLFELPWETGEDHVGYGLLDGDRYVGFASYLYGPADPATGRATTCNFSTWVVDPAHRTAAMSLAMPALKRRDLVVTNLTSLPHVHDIFTRLGFTSLETHMRVHPVVPAAVTAAGEVAFDDAITAAALGPAESTVFADHRGLTHAALVTVGARRAFVLFTRRRRLRLPSVRLHHVAPLDALPWALRPLQRALFRRFGVLVIDYDRRLATGAPSPFRDVPLDTPRLVRGKDVVPSALSNAYSETVLLNI